MIVVYKAFRNFSFVPLSRLVPASRGMSLRFLHLILYLLTNGHGYQTTCIVSICLKTQAIDELRCQWGSEPLKSCDVPLESFGKDSCSSFQRSLNSIQIYTPSVVYVRTPKQTKSVVTCQLSVVKRRFGNESEWSREEREFVVLAQEWEFSISNIDAHMSTRKEWETNNDPGNHHEERTMFPRLRILKRGNLERSLEVSIYRGIILSWFTLTALLGDLDQML